MLKPFLNKATFGTATGATGAKALHRNAAESAQLPGSTAGGSQQSGLGSPIIGVLGSKGGVGATTLALNLAAAIARDFAAVTIVDANLQQPDAAILVGRQPDFTVLELVERADDMTPEIVSACSTPVSTLVPGCRLVSPPTDGRGAIKTDLTAMAECLNKMRSCSPVWLIDLPRHLDRHLVTMMDICDVIVLVSEPTLTSINSAKRWSQVFEDLEYPESKIVMTLNRVGGKVNLVEDELRKIAPYQDKHSVPNAYEMSERCVTRGEPIVASHPRAPLSVAVSKLAASIMARWNHV